MAAYWIARARLSGLNDAQKAGMARYREIVMGAVERHPFITLSRSSRIEVLEGTTHFDQFFLHEFPSMEAALAFYHSPEYQEAATIRRACCDGELVIIDGVDTVTLG